MMQIFLKIEKKLLRILLKWDTSKLPNSICHWTPGEYGYGWENSEKWILQIFERENSDSDSLNNSNLLEYFDYESVKF